MRARHATLRGVVSVLVWATSVPVSRIALEELGLYLGTSIVLLGAAVFLLSLTTIGARGVGWTRRLSLAHLGVCGPLFVGYELLLYAAVGLARSREQAIVAGLANYLWPSLIFVFSVLLLRTRVRRSWLGAGIFACVGGIALAASGDAGGWLTLARAVPGASLSVGLGASAAVCWGLYSVLATVFRQTESRGAIGLFLFVAGATALPLGLNRIGEAAWSWQAIAAVSYMALVPNSVAYWLWDEAMRDGNVPTLAALANAIPVLSAAIGAVLLGLGARIELLVGASLVTFGAGISRLSFRGVSRRSARVASIASASRRGVGYLASRRESPAKRRPGAL
jgi:drug/metabolite transporter (DMT)-like permease